MQLEDQLLSLNLSKKLKEIGINSVNTYKILKIFRLECEEHAELHIKIMEKRKDQEHEVNI
jgi:hypothetical protein